MIAAIAHAKPALPGQVDRQCGEVKHHPAKDIGNGLRVGKDRVRCQVWVCSGRVRQGGETDRDGGEAGGNHRLHEQGSGATMQRTPFFTGDWNPHHNQTDRAGGNMQPDQPLEQCVGRHHQIPPTYCVGRVGTVR